jgi:hypothetical protein
MRPTNEEYKRDLLMCTNSREIPDTYHPLFLSLSQGQMEGGGGEDGSKECV